MHADLIAIPLSRQTAGVTSLPSPSRNRKRRLRRVGAVVVLVVAAIGSWYVIRYHIRDQYLFPRNFVAVEPGQVFRSGQISRHLIGDTLRHHNIKVIVFMSRDDRRIDDVDAECRISAELGIERHNFSLAGNGVGNPQRYADALEVLVRSQTQGKATLVHCNAGSQRTGGVVALYRTLIQGRSGRDAYHEMCAAGHDPADNPKLIPFLNANMGLIAADLQRRGVLAEVPATLPRLSP